MVTEHDCVRLVGRPAPKLSVQIKLHSVDEGCPDSWATCLTIAEASSLASYLSEVLSWQRDVQTQCGPGTSSGSSS